MQKAIGKLRAISADEEERHGAEARDRALSDEVTMLNAARREGRCQTAIAMLEGGKLDIATIAICTGLSEDEVCHLAAAQTH